MGPALDAAERWRDLILASPLPADLFIAEVQLRRGNADEAAKCIQPYLADARQKPDNYRPVILVQASILLRQDKQAQAADLLWPMVGKSPQWRMLWLEMAMLLVGDPPTAAAWLNRIAPVIPEPAIEEQIALANVWYQLALRSKDAHHRQNATDLLNRLAARNDKNAAVLFARAVVDAQAGRMAEAEKGYRKAMELDENLPLAQNNLAMILADRDRNLDEAMRLASKAVEARPDLATFHDTLGYVQAKARDYKNAVASLKTAIQLEPGNPLWRLNLATIHQQAGQSDQAADVLKEIDLLVPDKSRLQEDLRTRLEQLRASSTPNRRPRFDSQFQGVARYPFLTSRPHAVGAFVAAAASPCFRPVNQSSLSVFHRLLMLPSSASAQISSITINNGAVHSRRGSSISFMLALSPSNERTTRQFGPAATMASAGL